MSSLVKETLLQRYFSQELRSMPGGESDIVQACRRLLDERQAKNVMRLLQAIHQYAFPYLCLSLNMKDLFPGS
eukprot:c25391_g1_i4 orf=444-662(-)